MKIIVDDIVRGLDPKNIGQGQASFELSIEAVATSTHLNPSIRWLQAILNSLVSWIENILNKNTSFICKIVGFGRILESRYQHLSQK